MKHLNLKIGCDLLNNSYLYNCDLLFKTKQNCYKIEKKLQYISIGVSFPENFKYFI
jgi:hypothetical protein